VKAAYEAFAGGGLDEYLEHFTDDVVTVRDERSASGHEYATPEQAFAAAGLSE
jgi:ketosteroid isomerase-like protein